jgi:hypothetical protein
MDKLRTSIEHNRKKQYNRSELAWCDVHAKMRRGNYALRLASVRHKGPQTESSWGPPQTTHLHAEFRRKCKRSQSSEFIRKRPLMLLLREHASIDSMQAEPR